MGRPFTGFPATSCRSRRPRRPALTAEAAPAERECKGIRDLPGGFRRTPTRGQGVFQPPHVRRVPVGDCPGFVGKDSGHPPYLSQLARTCKFGAWRSFLLDRALRSRWRLCRLRMRRTPCGCGPFVSGLSAAAHAAVGLRHAPAGAVFSARPNGVPARAQRSGSRGERRSKGSERSFRRRRKRS